MENDIVKVEVVNGNELDCMLGIYVNEEGRAQVIANGNAKELMNMAVHVLIDVANTVSSKGPFDNKKTIDLIAKTAKEHVDENIGRCKRGLEEAGAPELEWEEVPDEAVPDSEDAKRKKVEADFEAAKEGVDALHQLFGLIEHLRKKSRGEDCE